MTAVAKLDEILEKAQEFASTWSLVGGKFDDGTLFAASQERKEELRTLVRAALSPAELGGVDYRKIAHEIYCHVGQCHGEPMCFLAEDEGTQSRWIDAVQTVITYHISTPRAAEAVSEEMVEAFARVYWKGDWPFKPDTEANRELIAEFRDVIKRGLTAALLTPPSAKGEKEL